MTSHTPSDRPADRPVPSSNAVLKRALKWDALIGAAVLVVAAVLGVVFAGMPGLWSALIGAGVATIFIGITAASILLANRYTASDLYLGVFFGLVLGSWVLKFILFIVLAVLLKPQPWIAPKALFLSVIAGVIGSLVVDTVVFLRSRVLYADVPLPRWSDLQQGYVPKPSQSPGVPQPSAFDEAPLVKPDEHTTEGSDGRD